MLKDTHLTQEQRFRLMRMATYASVTVAASLIGVKFYAWWVTDSISLQATLLDSILDALASIVNLFAVRHAQQPADKEHRFGHGKTEAIAALGQSLFIAASACWLLYEALERFANPQAMTGTTLGVIVMIFSIVATGFLIWFQIYVVQRTKSAAIRADSVHYQSDLIINMGVILSLVVTSWLNIPWVDPLIGTLIAGYILYTAYTIVLEAFDILMDRELDDEVREDIHEIIMSSDSNILGYHDLRTRSSGIHSFIQFHLELDGNMSLFEAHSISEKTMRNVMKAYPHAEVIIHEDPEGIEAHTNIIKD